MKPGDPIERPPRAVRPPYDQADQALDAITSDLDAWRVARQLDRLAALREPLAGLHVTEYEHHQLEWLAGWDVPTVAVFASLLWRARQAEPQADTS